MEKKQNEYYKTLNSIATISLAEEVVGEVYYNQIKIVKEQQKKIEEKMEEMGIENVSFVNTRSTSHPEFIRRSGLVFGFEEIRYAGQESKQLFEGGVIDRGQNRIYRSVGVSEDPLGYKFGFSVKFPELKDERKNNIPVDINRKDLEKKLKENNLNPYSVRKTITKYRKDFQTAGQIYKVFFIYEISKEKIDGFRTLPNETARETIKNDFGNGIGKTLEDAIDCIVDFKLEKYSKIKVA